MLHLKFKAAPMPLLPMSKLSQAESNAMPPNFGQNDVNEQAIDENVMNKSPSWLSRLGAAPTAQNLQDINLQRIMAPNGISAPLAGGMVHGLLSPIAGLPKIMGMTNKDITNNPLYDPNDTFSKIGNAVGEGADYALSDFFLPELSLPRQMAMASGIGATQNPNSPALGAALGGLSPVLGKAGASVLNPSSSAIKNFRDYLSAQADKPNQLGTVNTASKDIFDKLSSGVGQNRNDLNGLLQSKLSNQAGTVNQAFSDQFNNLFNKAGDDAQPLDATNAALKQLTNNKNPSLFFSQEANPKLQATYSSANTQQWLAANNYARVGLPTPAWQMPLLAFRSSPNPATLNAAKSSIWNRIANIPDALLTHGSVMEMHLNALSGANDALSKDADNLLEKADLPTISDILKSASLNKVDETIPNSLGGLAANPSLKNLHVAQSAVGNNIRNLAPAIARGDATAKITSDRLLTLQNALNTDLSNGLQQKGLDDFYNKLSRNYMSQAVPYKAAPIENILNGKFPASISAKFANPSTGFDATTGSPVPTSTSILNHGGDDIRHTLLADALMPSANDPEKLLSAYNQLPTKGLSHLQTDASNQMFDDLAQKIANYNQQPTMSLAGSLINHYVGKKMGDFSKYMLPMANHMMPISKGLMYGAKYGAKTIPQLALGAYSTLGQ